MSRHNNVLGLPGIIKRFGLGAYGLTIVGQTVACSQTKPTVAPVASQTLTITSRIRPLCPIRLGGVYVRGEAFDANVSTGKGVISAADTMWIANHLDVAALNAPAISADTFPSILKAQRLFTPLLFTYASTLYEADHNGNVGGWRPAMTSLTLTDAKSKEIVHPDAGAHWMDFGSQQWATHWRTQVVSLVHKYGAFGVVAAELPIGNSAVTTPLEKYHSLADRAAATADWLRAVNAKGQFLLIPSAIGFELGAGHATLPTPPGTQELELPGRLWDEYFPMTDGAWAEGWLHPYWAEGEVSEEQWEIAVEAADRAARNDQVFIATSAYANDHELEFELASYLLAIHRQGRLVFQPMPLAAGTAHDAGLSLSVAQKELKEKSYYFDVPLGVALQERHQVQVTHGNAWRRAFANGLVYVNSDDRRSVTVELGGPMMRPTGERVRSVELRPHSGTILVYPTPAVEHSEHSGSKVQVPPAK